MKKDKFNLKQEYSNLKYKLPKFDDLDYEFEISLANIKNKEFLLRNIRRRINDKIILFCRIIENLIYPNQNNLITMFELKSFSEEEKDNMLKLYKRLMKFERKSLILDVNPDDKEDFEYINNVYRLWKEFKDEILKITEKMERSWGIEDKPLKDVYFG